MTPLFVKLADPAHRLPVPGAGGRLFLAAGETVDGDDPFWIGCLADGSVVRASQPEASPASAAPAAPVAPAAPAAPAATLTPAAPALPR